MKIKKRRFAEPIISFQIVLIPLMTFILLSVNDTIKPEMRWVWFLGLPLLVCLWFIINYRIEKK